MSFSPNAHGPVRWWNNPRFLPKGAAVVVVINNERVRLSIAEWYRLEKAAYGTPGLGGI